MIREVEGRPLSLVVTSGQRHDSPQLAAVLDAIRVPRPGGRGARLRPCPLPASERRRTLHQPPEAGGGIATRFPKRADNYHAMLLLVSLMLGLA